MYEDARTYGVGQINRATLYSTSKIEDARLYGVSKIDGVKAYGAGKLTFVTKFGARSAIVCWTTILGVWWLLSWITLFNWQVFLWTSISQKMHIGLIVLWAPVWLKLMSRVRNAPSPSRPPS